jgi:hypothetical protein
MVKASMQARTKLPTVFLSFASEDWPWVNNFRRDEWFGDFLGAAQITDYKDPGCALPYGRLGTWITDTVEGAAAVLLFLSDSYTRKKATVNEFRATLEEAQRRKIEIVPVLLDHNAINWWNEWKAEGALAVLGDDYQHARFFGNGRRKQVVTDAGYYIDETITQIRALAELIRGRINGPRAVVEKRSDYTLVVLGHPTDRLAIAVADQVEQLKSALGPSQYTSLSDGWRRSRGARDQAALAPAATYVQPLGYDADDYLENPERVRRWLESLRPSAPNPTQIVLWAPLCEPESEFSKAAANPNAKDPVLRAESGAGLAKWLRALTGADNRPDTPVVQVEDWSEMTGPGVGVRRRVHELFSQTLDMLVRPKPETWPFQGELFKEQLRQLLKPEVDGRRVIRLIVAVHDMNIKSFGDDRGIRAAIENKFSEFQESFAEECRDMSVRVDVFWTALLVRHAEVLPFGRWPATSRLEEWSALRFRHVDDANIQIELDADSREMYLGSLHEWVQRSQGAAT